jgi:transposase
MLVAVPEPDPPDPPDLQAVLAKLEKLGGKLAAAEAELARKDQLIEALQRRLFGRSSERLDPAQEQLDFEGGVLGKPAPPPGDGRSTQGGEGEKGAKRSRRRKAELFPENLRVVVGEVLVPDEVAADPGAFEEIGEEYHDELDITRSEVFWRRTVGKKFVAVADRSRPPLAAPAPEPGLPGTLCAPGLAAKIVADKYCDHRVPRARDGPARRSLAQLRGR